MISSRYGPDTLIDSIPKILFWIWTSLFLGLLATFFVTLVLQQSTRVQTYSFSRFSGTERATMRMRRGSKIHRTSIARPELIEQGRMILRSAAKND